MSDLAAEAEVATLPGATFTVSSVRRYAGGIVGPQPSIDVNKVFIVTSKQTA